MQSLIRLFLATALAGGALQMSLHAQAGAASGQQRFPDFGYGFAPSGTASNKLFRLSQAYPAKSPDASRKPAFFKTDGDRLPLADEVDCLLSLHDARLEAQAKEFLDHLVTSVG